MDIPPDNTPSPEVPCMTDGPSGLKDGGPSQIRTILLTGIVSLAVGVGSGLLINHLTEKRPRLSYDVTTQEVFPGEKHNIGIFALRVANDGNEEIEQVFCQLRFPHGKVSERRVAGIPESAPTIGGSGNGVDIGVPFLNPNEQFSVQVLLADVEEPLVPPTIEVRGKGITGSEAEPSEGSTSWLGGLLPLMMAALATLLTAFMALVTRRKVTLTRITKSVDSTRHLDDQRDIFSFVLETHGLSEDAQTIRGWPRKLSYWATSDFLCAQWITRNDALYTMKGVAALETLMGYAAISKDSQRIVLLNMAKLAEAAGEPEVAIRHLETARKVRDPIIEKRITNDQALTSLVGEAIE